MEGHSWGLETALRGASERLAPILMTALVTGLGLLPLAIGSGDPGREIEGPMAIVILGGLVTSTLLNLLVLPTLALHYGRFQASPQRVERFPRSNVLSKFCPAVAPCWSRRPAVCGFGTRYLGNRSVRAPRSACLQLPFPFAARGARMSGGIIGTILARRDRRRARLRRWFRRRSFPENKPAIQAGIHLRDTRRPP